MSARVGALVVSVAGSATVALIVGSAFDLGVVSVLAIAAALVLAVELTDFALNRRND